MAEKEVWTYIYIAAPVGSESPCKIGFSGNPQQRVDALSCGSSVRLELRGAYGCFLGAPEWGSSNPYRNIRRKAHDIERSIHRELQIFKRHGEWFDIEAISAEFVALRQINAAGANP